MPSELRGFSFMIGSSLCFATMGLFVKLGCERLPVAEVTFFRAFGGFAFTALLMIATRQPFVPRDRGLLVLRGVLGWCSMMSYFIALSGLHLADAVLLNYTSPFFTCLLAAAVLGEQLGARGIACLALATTGVACVVGPQGGFWNWYALAAIGSAALAAMAYVAVKRANANNTPWTIAVIFSLVASVLTLPPMLWSYRAPDAQGWLLLLGAGAAGTLGQLFMTFGYRHARASTASIVTLFTPLLSALLAIVFLGAGPTTGTWLGGALILAAGLLLSAPGFQRKERILPTREESASSG